MSDDLDLHDERPVCWEDHIMDPELARFALKRLKEATKTQSWEKVAHATTLLESALKRPRKPRTDKPVAQSGRGTEAAPQAPREPRP